MSIVFAKTENRKAKQFLSLGYQWEGDDTRKESQKVNMVEILCIHVNETCRNYSRNKDKGE
jgi:hypothetical protein